MPSRSGPTTWSHLSYAYVILVETCIALLFLLVVSLKYGWRVDLNEGSVSAQQIFLFRGTGMKF